MIIDNVIKINISNRNITYYRKFYPNISFGENIIKIEHLKCGSDIKIKVLCDKCSNIIYKKFNNLNRDRNNNNGLDFCVNCGRKNPKKNQRLDFNIIYNEFISKNLIPIFTKDDNILTNNKLPYKCVNHNSDTQYIEYSALTTSYYACKYCRKERMSYINKKKFSEIKEYFISRNLIPMFNESDINGIYKKLQFLCKTHKDKIQYISYDSLTKTKEGCKICFSKSGENSHRWKGGITPLVRNMRIKIDSWKKLKLKENNYICNITGLGGKLEVHHIFNFNELLKKSLKVNNYEVKNNISDYTTNELKQIETTLINLHEKIPYSVIIKDLHILFHKIYGKKKQ